MALNLTAYKNFRGYSYSRHPSSLSCELFAAASWRLLPLGGGTWSVGRDSPTLSRHCLDSHAPSCIRDNKSLRRRVQGGLLNTSSCEWAADHQVSMQSKLRSCDLSFGPQNSADALRLQLTHSKTGDVQTRAYMPFTGRQGSFASTRHMLNPQL